MEWWSSSRPGRFSPGNETRYYCTVSWVDLRAVLDECEGEKIVPIAVRTPNPAFCIESQYRVNTNCFYP